MTILGVSRCPPFPVKDRLFHRPCVTSRFLRDMLLIQIWRCSAALHAYWFDMVSRKILLREGNGDGCNVSMYGVDTSATIFSTPPHYCPIPRGEQSIHYQINHHSNQVIMQIKTSVGPSLPRRGLSHLQIFWVVVVGRPGHTWYHIGFKFEIMFSSSGTGFAIGHFKSVLFKVFVLIPAILSQQPGALSVLLSSIQHVLWECLSLTWSPFNSTMCTCGHVPLLFQKERSLTYCIQSKGEKIHELFAS